MSFATLLFAADYKLTDLMSVAGATIGIIIAGAILLGSFNAKYGALFADYRQLTGELRGNHASDQRRESLRWQISEYRARLRWINIASLAMTMALLTFLVSVGVAGASVVFPQALWLRTLGTLALFAGLVLIGVAVCLDAADLSRSRRAIAPEAHDFSDVPETVGAAPR